MTDVPPPRSTRRAGADPQSEQRLQARIRSLERSVSRLRDQNLELYRQLVNARQEVRRLNALLELPTRSSNPAHRVRTMLRDRASRNP